MIIYSALFIVPRMSIEICIGKKFDLKVGGLVGMLPKYKFCTALAWKCDSKTIKSAKERGIKKQKI